MPLHTFLQSASFHLFLDETLLQQAEEAVRNYLDNHDKKAQKNQLYAIQTAVQSRGWSGLKDLADNQQSKNSHETNKAFWQFIASLIDTTGTPPDFSLIASLRQVLSHHGWWEDENVTDRTEKNRRKKANRAVLDQVLPAALPIYFEHFICEYFYRT